MTALRNAAAYLSTIAVYLIAWIFLGISENEGMIGPANEVDFLNIVLVSLFGFIIPSGDVVRVVLVAVVVPVTILIVF